MWALGVVVLAPAFDHDPSLGKAVEGSSGQELGAEPADGQIWVAWMPLLM